MGRLKLEHAIIEGLRPVLENLAVVPGIALVVPGRIAAISGHTQLRIRVTVKTVNGWKLTACIPSAAQEVFVSTTLTKEEVEAAVKKCLEAY